MTTTEEKTCWRCKHIRLEQYCEYCEKHQETVVANVARCEDFISQLPDQEQE